MLFCTIFPFESIVSSLTVSPTVTNKHVCRILNTSISELKLRTSLPEYYSSLVWYMMSRACSKVYSVSMKKKM